MEKSKFLKISVVILLLLNLGLTGFLYISRPKGHGFGGEDRHEGRLRPKDIIIDKLHFDLSQQKRYDVIIHAHQTRIKELDEDIRETKKELYLLLSQTTLKVKAKDSLIVVLNSCQKQIEETHFNHFENIKKICRADQLDDYNRLTEELSRIFVPGKPPRQRND